jgi:hypothetical protein
MPIASQALARLRTWTAPRRRQLLLLLGFLAALYLSWYLTRPAATRFHATVRTQSLSFSLGPWPDSAGIFNSDAASVDLTLLGPTVIRSDTGSSRRCAPGTAFGKVKLLAVATFEKLRVGLDVENGGLLRYTLTPAAAGSDPFASVLVDEESSRNGLACEPQNPTLPVGEWRVLPSESGDPLAFSVRFASTSTARWAAAGSAAKIPASEQNIPLADSTTVLFQGESGLVNSDKNQIRLLRSDRPINLASGLTLGGLEKASIVRLSFDPGSQWLDVTVAGSARKIAVKIGGEDISEAEMRLALLLPSRLGGFATAVATVLGALATICYAYFYIREQRRLEREREPAQRKAVTPDDRYPLS